MTQPPSETQPSPAAAGLLQALLAHPDIDGRVGPGRAGPAGAAQPGTVLGSGLAVRHDDEDPYRLAWAAVDRAVSDVIAAGAAPGSVVLQAHFSELDPDSTGGAEALVRCTQGSHEVAQAYETRFVTAVDSSDQGFADDGDGSETYPGLLLIKSVGVLPDMTRVVTIDLKQAGNFIFVVGDTRPELGGSHYALVGGLVRPQHCTAPAPVDAPLDRLRALHRAIGAGLVRACHHCGAGGIGVALAQMCLAGQLGAEIQMRAVPVDLYYAYAADEAVLFSESLTRFLVEVRPTDAAELSTVLGDVPHACIGVVGGGALRIHPRLPEAADPLLVMPVAAR